MEAFEADRLHEAHDLFQRAASLGFDVPAESFAICAQALDLDGQAVGLFDQAIKNAPDDCNLLFMRAMSKSKLGDLKGAETDFERAIELGNKDTSLNREYAMSAKEMGHPDGHTSIYEFHLSVCRMKKLRKPDWKGGV